jgi:hypothetical protein
MNCAVPILKQKKASDVSIRIPLSVVLAGSYKVGLSPREERPSIYRYGGWITPKGGYLSLDHNKHQLHEDWFKRLGVENYPGAAKIGAIRVAVWRGDYIISVLTLDDSTRSLLKEFIAGAPEAEINIDWDVPKKGLGRAQFENKEEALDWLENRTRTASSKTAVSLPALVQQTNAFSTKNRPGCTPKLVKSDPKSLMLQYQVTCHLKESDPRGHEVRVKFDASKIEEDQNANDLDIQVSCSCPAFLYWGAQWNLHQRDGLLGEPRPLLQAPKERLDLRSNFVICKHCKGVFERILPSVQNNINTIIRKKKVEEATRQREEKGTPPPTIKRQPGQKAPSKEVEEMEALIREEKKKLIEQESVIERQTPATNEEKKLHPTITEKPKPRWRQTIDNLKTRINNWGKPVPTPDEKEPPQQNEDQRIQQELLREERRKIKMPMEKKHPEENHADKGLPYKPRWQQFIKKFKDRIKNWGKK